jgi:hypothetical protein
MDDWRKLHSEFMAIADEEYNADPHAVSRAAYGAYTQNDEFGNWTIPAGNRELLCARFELIATKAGIALGTPGGVRPMYFWLHRLREYLANSKSNYLGKAGESIPIIRGVCYASAMFCARLETESLEQRVELLETQVPDSPTRTIPDALASREERLQGFIKEHDTKIAAVCRSAKVFKANMQQWRHEELADDSVMSERIEDVLSGKTPLVRRGKKKG